MTDIACRQLRNGGQANLDQAELHQPRDGRTGDLDRNSERCCDSLDGARLAIEREQDHFLDGAPSPGALDDGARAVVPGRQVEFHAGNLPFSSTVTMDAPLILAIEPSCPMIVIFAAGKLKSELNVAKSLSRVGAL